MSKRKIRKEKMDYKEILSCSPRETMNSGARLAKYLRKKDLICLFGDLGSGKTVFIKGIAQGLGIKKEDILSPSFVLIREHQTTDGPFYHLDLYRLKSYKEIYSLGYEEYLECDGMTVIEWADKIERLLPNNYLRIEFSVEGKSQRRIRFIPYGQRYIRLLDSLSLDKG